jgi:hypothetical protein
MEFEMRNAVPSSPPNGVAKFLKEGKDVILHTGGYRLPVLPIDSVVDNPKI